MNKISLAYITKELERQITHDTKWPDFPGQDLYRELKKELISLEYIPGLGHYPCQSVKDGIERIGQWLFYEFKNRLDFPDVKICKEAIKRVAPLVCNQMKEKSRAEIRYAIDTILHELGFPQISESFRKHNSMVDHLVIEKIKLLSPSYKEKNLPEWLQFLASANLIELWPSANELHINYTLNRVFETTPAIVEFSSLAKIIENKLKKKVPVGFMTDNHGEIIIDLAFLSWFQSQYPTNFQYIIPKRKSVETDIDALDVSKNIEPFFPGLTAKIIGDGSSVQGNLLTTASEEVLKTLLEIKNKNGILLVKGLANFETMVGLQVDAIFLFAVKTPFVAKLLELEKGSLVGLWVPVGCTKIGVLSTLHLQSNVNQSPRII